MKKYILILYMLIFFLMVLPFTIKAESYNYNPLQDAIYSAEAMTVEIVIDSSNLVNTENIKANIIFGELVDVFGHKEYIYLVDQSTGLIHILNSEYQYITSFGQENGISLNSPEGIFVTDDAIYVTDTGNHRVAIFNHDFELVSEILAPDDPTFKQNIDDTSGYDFRPLKITVHKTGRIYVIADQIFEGILDFNSDGTFSRYVGANTVTLSVWEAFWLNFTSEEQRLSQGFRLATTFKNLNIDEMGYLYTVSGLDEGEEVIKKLNYKGQDVLTRNGYVPQVGDMVTVPSSANVPDSPSEFIDIDVNSYGNYVVLDSTRGRLFTYDFEGNLLYVAGQLGNISNDNSNERDLFLSPQALSYYNDNVLVVDSLNKNLVVFGYTEFGSLVNEAINYYYDGDYESSKDVWEEVLVLNSNYYLAYSGIAKAELRSGNYEKAMNYAKLGYDDYTYSSAYQPYRYSKLVVVFPYIIGFVMFGLIYSFIKNITNSVRKAREEEGYE